MFSFITMNWRGRPLVSYRGHHDDARGLLLSGHSHIQPRRRTSTGSLDQGWVRRGCGMAVTIEPLGATLGAVVTGARLADLDDATWVCLEAAFTEHALLVFPDQHLSDDEQAAFGRRFGEVEDLG